MTSDEPRKESELTPAQLRAEIERLERENNMLLSLAESASDIVAIIGGDGTLKRSFRARERVLGYEPEEVQGMNVFDLIHPDDKSLAIAALTEIAAAPGASKTLLLRARKKTGEWVHLEAVGQNRIYDPDIGGILFSSRDVTERLELERRLRLAQRMEAVGRLASGVAHDFNNLLTVVTLAAEQISIGGPDAQHATADILRAARIGGAVAKRLLGLARETPARRELYDLNELVASAADTIGTLVPERIQLAVERSPEAAPVEVDRGQIEQVLLNLTLNARDALPRRGTIRIAVENLEHEVVLTVSDDGVGMDPETMARAFEPFFTTKTFGRGTGLGLWIVQDAVEQSEGTIAIDSDPERGTSVTVRLPRVSLESEAPSPALAVTKKKLSILVAEDEPTLRDRIGHALANRGHRVLSASDGQDALELAEHESFDLLVSDVLMRHVDGPELAARLREKKADLPVLFISGYGDEVAKAASAPNTLLLRKPFTAEELLARISDLVDD